MNNDNRKEHGDSIVVAPQEQFALVPTNQAVVRASRRLKWKPETLIRRIEACMTSLVEQIVYLEIAKESSHQPRTFKDILKIFCERDLSPNDLKRNFDGKQWHESRVESIQPKIYHTLYLIRRVPNDYETLRLKADTAATLVELFGEEAITFIDSIADEWQEVAEALGMSPKIGKDKIMRSAIWIWKNRILPDCEKNGIPYQIRFMNYFEDEFGQLRYDRINFAREAEDYLTEQTEESGETDV